MIVKSSIVSNPDTLKRLISEHDIRFFDFGCSHGEVTLWIQSTTNTRGIGFDIDKRKLALADANGLICCDCDILKIPQKKLVAFTTMFHMLEHLESMKSAREFIFKACTISREYVYIKQPYFDADAALFHCGYKTFYSHWRGHRNHMTTPDFYHILSDLRTANIIKDFSIGYNKPIVSTNNENIHPITSPKDSSKYDASKHPPKPIGHRFNFPLYDEIHVVILLSDGGDNNIPKQLLQEYIAYDSRQPHNFSCPPEITGLSLKQYLNNTIIQLMELIKRTVDSRLDKNRK